MAEYKGYQKQEYLRGKPELNLILNERRLLISALIRANWDTEKAYKMNYPTEYVSIDAYRKSLKKHHILLKEKKILKFSEIN